MAVEIISFCGRFIHIDPDVTSRSAGWNSQDKSENGEMIRSRCSVISTADAWLCVCICRATKEIFNLFIPTFASRTPNCSSLRSSLLIKKDFDVTVE